MIAIVESGSTKSDWRLVADDKSVTPFITLGFNPYFMDADEIAAELLSHAILQQEAATVTQLWFYGAGCSSPSMNEVVAHAFRQVFINARVVVAHDLLGAALATGKGSACLVGILGTGSNACYFDGEDIHNGLPSLGYVLGDEASGAWFGKRIVADHIHGLLPPDMHRQLDGTGVDRELVLTRVYREPRPNTFLAAFTPLLSEFRDTDYAQSLLREGLDAFLTRYVCAFPQHRELPLHFVGSVAFHFQKELRDRARLLGLQVGEVTQHPVEGLLHYHLSGK